MDALSDEVLAHIFSFLDSKAKSNASSVCKHWMEVFNQHQRLLENVQVVFYAEPAEEILEFFNALTRNFSYFHIKYVDFDEGWLSLLQLHGKRFRRLVIEECALIADVDDQCRKVDSFTGLSELQVWDSHVLWMLSDLPALERLDLKTTESFAERDLEHLHQIAPSGLIHFCIENVNRGDKTYNAMFYQKMRQFVHMRRFNLETLDVGGLRIPDKEMDRLKKVNMSRFKRFKEYADFKPKLDSFIERQLGILSLVLEEEQ